MTSCDSCTLLALDSQRFGQVRHVVMAPWTIVLVGPVAASSIQASPIDHRVAARGEVV